MPQCPSEVKIFEVAVQEIKKKLEVEMAPEPHGFKVFQGDTNWRGSSRFIRCPVSGVPQWPNGILPSHRQMAQDVIILFIQVLESVAAVP